MRQTASFAPSGSSAPSGEQSVSVETETTTEMDTDLDVDGSGSFAVFGFEYWSDPAQPEEGYISWVVEGEKVYTARASDVRPAPESGVSRRLISEEPMVRLSPFLSLFFPFFLFYVMLVCGGS